MVPGFDLLLMGSHDVMSRAASRKRFSFGLPCGLLSFDRPLSELRDNLYDHDDWVDCIMPESIFQSVYMSVEEQVPLVFDTGASISLTPFKSD